MEIMVMSEPDVKVDVEILKRDIDRFSGLFDRLDTTIEKLTEVSGGINRMLAVHETRLEQQEELTKHFITLMEERRRENSDKYEIVQNRITQTRDEMQQEIKDSIKEVVAKIDKLSETVNKLEKWKYLVVGGAITIGFLLAKLPMIEKLLH
jgi:CRISPR/Cas system CMR subunit Cmr4 (Cas7 group RAMP superfamily)